MSMKFADRVKDIEMSINTGKKNYVLKGKVTTNDIIIDKKLYKTFILDATVKRREKSPYHSSSINIVFLKEGENIPVLIIQWRIIQGEKIHAN